jgi:hypothetical protein
MSIKGFRVRNSFTKEIRINSITPKAFYMLSDEIELCWAAWERESLSYKMNRCAEAFIIEFHTGTYDRNNVPIFEGDTLRQMSCTQTFVVEDIVSFLLMCGRYEERHAAPIFDSLEIVKEEIKND